MKSAKDPAPSGPLDAGQGASLPAIQVLQDALQDTIAVLQSRRTMLGDALVDAALSPLLDRLAQLATPVAPPRRLRQVSVLFLDIVGSTQLIQQLEPEDVQSVLDGALAAFTALVTRHGGEVLRYAGDNLKAAFGASGTREDDAERAVFCGLALLQEAARRSDAVRQAHGLDGFNARVGIHTGPAVRGGGVEHENSLSGLAVNVAARMEQAAPPGGLRISVDTYRQVQGGFEVEEQPALQVKGLQEPMRTFLVRGVRERRLRGLRHGADGVASAMIGRDEQLARLRRVADAVFAPGGGLGAATLVGDAGMGKSRLLAEFQAVLPAPTRAGALWRASSHPQALYQPYGLLRDLLFWHLGVRDSDTQAQAQQAFATALAPVFGAAADEQTALLGQLIGLDYAANPHIAGILSDAKQLQARGLNAWVRFLRLQAAEQALVLVLDDLQWADDASLNALDHLVAVAPELPLMLLCAARPELLERRPQWAAQWPRHEALNLSPLTAQGSADLAAALLARFAAPVPALQALLSGQAAGNPYYMEALLQMVVDTGVIDTASEPWQVQQHRLQGLQVPGTLVGVLQATLDALDAEQRRSLQQASVVGAQFWDEALSAIDPSAPEQLPALSRRELVLPQAQSAFDGAGEYSFRHHLLHQVTYGTVLKPDKRQAHGQAALWLQGRSRGRENELASQIAEHFDRASDAGQAIAWWLRAAEDAVRRQADTAALAHADRALALDDGTDLQRQVRAHRVRAQVFMGAGRAVEHGAEVAVLQSLAERLDDDDLRLALAHDIVWRMFNEARYEEAIELGQRHLTRPEARSPAAVARVYKVMFPCFSRLGRDDEAVEHAHKALEHARAAGDLVNEGDVLNNLGLHHLDALRMPQALACYEQALRVYEASGNRRGVITVRSNLAVVEETLLRPENARDLLWHVVAESQEAGSLRLEGLARANLAGLLAELGESQLGYDTALEALRLAKVTGERRTEAFAHRGARMAAHAMGRWSQALEHARAGRAGFIDCGHPFHAWHEASLVAVNLFMLGEPAQALAEVDALLAKVAERGGWGDFFEAPYHLHCVLASIGDARAGGLLAAAFQGLNKQAERYAEHVPRDNFMRGNTEARGICDAWAAAHPGAAGLTSATAAS